VYDAEHERKRRERDTPERIMDITRRQGEFTVSLRYRDHWLRARCNTLKSQGFLRLAGRRGHDLVYQPTGK